MNISKSRASSPTAPEKGSFPLDHFSECKIEMAVYMDCLKQNDYVSRGCISLSRDYFKCRMDNGLMAYDADLLDGIDQAASFKFPGPIARDMDSMSTVTYTKESVISDLRIDEAEIINLLLVGSRLHGTASPASDFDFILIVKDGTHLPEGSKVERDDLDVTIFTRTEYTEKLKMGEDFQTIETLWLPDAFRWIFKEDFLAHYNSDLSHLRVAVSSIANKGHAYAKILMTKENNFNLGKKNLAHEIRNLRLGIQITEHGSIIDYTESMDIYALIMAETSNDWNFYNERWGSIAMAHQKEFISKTPQKIKLPKPPKQRAKKLRGSAKTPVDPKNNFDGSENSEASPSQPSL